MDELTDNTRQPQRINIWLESLRSSLTSEATPAERAVKASKDEAILVLLAKLALQYWRPDFTAEQARQLYSDYLDDLRPYPMADIAEAIEKCRRSHENKFYPTPGQLLAFIEKRPSWDVGTHESYAAERRKIAREEIAKAAKRIGGGDVQNLIG